MSDPTKSEFNSWIAKTIHKTRSRQLFPQLRSTFWYWFCYPTTDLALDVQRRMSDVRIPISDFWHPIRKVALPAQKVWMRLNFFHWIRLRCISSAVRTFATEEQARRAGIDGPSHTAGWVLNKRSTDSRIDSRIFLFSSSTPFLLGNVVCRHIPRSLFS
jgi:hypothetical protein